MRTAGLLDIAALLSMGGFVVGFGLGLSLLVFFAFGPTLLGPLDQPIASGLEAGLVLLLVVCPFIAGGLFGGVAWIVAMSRLLPKRTMYKWLTYGPQIKPLLALNLRLLDRMFAGRNDGGTKEH